MEERKFKVDFKGEHREAMLKRFSLHRGGYVIKLKDGNQVHPSEVTFIQEEDDSYLDTMRHKMRMNELIEDFAKELYDRVLDHDNSKLGDVEKPHFDKAKVLSKLTYGSDEYKKALDDLKPALEHHYKNNSHHPEHYENGINDMNLFDIIEMFFDWKAASERHDNGDINKSIDHNHGRFQMSNQLAFIFRNTVTKLGWEK